jgi:creatinine amidohydrolase
MKLLETTTHDLARSKLRLAFWPVGTIEAHDLGPLGTDVIAPAKLATDLAPRFDALLLPALPFGLVASLAGYPGGMWLSEETYRRVVMELLGSLARSRSNVQEVILFNGHGGNTAALSAVLPEVWKAHGLKVAFFDWWTVGQDLAEKHFGSAAGHAGADELAVVRAADPGLAPPSWDGSRAFLLRPGVKAYPSPRSALRYSDGESRPLSPESAEAYYRELVERVAQVVDEILAGWSSFDPLGG